MDRKKALSKALLLRAVIWAAALLTALLLAAGPLRIWKVWDTAEDGGGKSGEEPVVLRLWYPWTDEEKIYKKAFLDAVDKYNKSHEEIQIKAEGIATRLYREKLPSAIASNDTPDIYLCYTNAYLKTAVDSGKVLRLNDYLDSKTEDKILPGMLDEMTFDGGIYGLGFARDAGIFFVNNEMFREYGCGVPESWEELLAVSRVFLDNGIVPLACSADTDRGYRMYLEALCMSEAGGRECLEIAAGEKEPSEAFLRGVSHFCELRDMGAFGSTPLKNTTGWADEEFNLSRIPMYFTKNRLAGNFLQQNSPLYGKISAVPFPGSGGDSILGGVSEAFVVNAAAKNPREAVEALSELMYDFSGNLKESRAGIPVWFLEDTEAGEDAALYNEIAEMDSQAEETMPYWEFYLGGKRAENFMRASGKLYRKEISAEEFAESLSR